VGSKYLAIIPSWRMIIRGSMLPGGFEKISVFSPVGLELSAPVGKGARICQ